MNERKIRNTVQNIFEWAFMLIIFSTMWCGFLVERPVSKAFFFTITLVMTVALNGVMRDKGKE